MPLSFLALIVLMVYRSAAVADSCEITDLCPLLCLLPLYPIVPSLSISFASGPVTGTSGGVSTLEMKKSTSPAHDAQFEPNGGTLKTPITDADVAAAMTTTSAERPAEEEGTSYECISLYSRTSL